MQKLTRNLYSSYRLPFASPHLLCLICLHPLAQTKKRAFLVVLGSLCVGEEECYSVCLLVTSCCILWLIAAVRRGQQQQRRVISKMNVNEKSVRRAPKLPNIWDFFFCSCSRCVRLGKSKEESKSLSKSLRERERRKSLPSKNRRCLDMVCRHNGRPMDVRSSPASSQKVYVCVCVVCLSFVYFSVLLSFIFFLSSSLRVVGVVCSAVSLTLTVSSINSPLLRERERERETLAFWSW